MGSFAGWSERALHLGFLLPALAVVLGTHRLARRLTNFPLLAAAATLLTPGFLVSSSSVMCDTMMLALWLFAVIFWLHGLDSNLPCRLRPIDCRVCADQILWGLTDPTVAGYSLFKKRRLGIWAWYLLIPLAILIGYQYGTHALYGRGLLSDAAQFAGLQNHVQGISMKAKTLVGLVFAGGCMFPALAFAPFLWSRRQMLFAAILSATVGLAIALRWVHIKAPANAYTHWHLVSGQMALYLAGGLSVLGLVIANGWRRADADWMLLSLWVLGTLLFTSFVNWTINARSILSMIPAVAILLARRLEVGNITSRRWRSIKTAAPLLVSGILSMWVAWADADLANAGRTAAGLIRHETRNASTPVYFEGHWGFQYYMEESHALPVDLDRTFHAGDIVAIPENNANIFGPPPSFALSGTVIELNLNSRVTTMSPPLGAGFYASVWGPLPFAVGPVPPERYRLSRLVPLDNRRPQPAAKQKP